MRIIRTILFILNIILALGLLLTTLAGSVAPSQTVLPSMAAYGFFPLLAANVIMVLIWALMKRWQAVLSIAVIALRWSMVGGYIQVGGTSHTPPIEEHPQMVTLMTHNVHQFQGHDIHDQTSDSIAIEFIKLVRKQKPEILCLQEFARCKKVNVVDSLAVLGYNHYYGARTGSGDHPIGTAVFSQLPITYVNRIDKQKLLVELLKEGQKFRVCCVHMDSYRFDDSDRVEIARARHGEVDEKLRPTIGKVKETILSHEKEWIDGLKAVVTECTVPLIVAGDMNDIASSWLYCQMKKEMTDCFREKGSGLSITYNGGFPQFRIDMVFHSEGLRTLSYRRLRNDLSDHYPVLTTLELVP